MQAVADCELRRNLRDGVTRGLRGQSRRSRYARVDLDHDHAPGFGVQSKLNVAPTCERADRVHHPNRLIAHSLILGIREGERWGDRDRVPSMYACRVEVLDGANHHEVAVGISQQFKLEFFPAVDALFDQHLVDRTAVQAMAQGFIKVLFLLNKASAGSAKCVGRANNQWEAYVLGDLFALKERLGHVRVRHVDSDLDHQQAKLIAVFGRLDGMQIRADYAYVVLFP